MKTLGKIRIGRTFRFFLILLLSIVLSVTVILVAQQAHAVPSVYSVRVDTVNGAPLPPAANIHNPVELAGNFSAQPGSGLEKEYGVQIGWGDGSPYTIWRYSDSGNAYPYLTWSPNDPSAKTFNGTYNTNPGSGYPDMGHNYTTGGNYIITVKFFHGQPPGAESADSSVSLSVHVLVPEIRVSKTGPAYAHEGDTITYNITVTNPSNDTTMYKVSVVDSLLGDVSSNFSASLNPLTSESKIFSYAVPSPSSNVLNTVTVTYEDLFNETKTATASWTSTVLHPSIQVTKTGPLYAHQGDVITYNITVTNPSTGTMTKVSVVDSLLGDVSGSFSASLGPLASESRTFAYTVPSPSGNIPNNVTVTYEDAGNQQWTASSSWTVTVLHPAIRVSKSGPTHAHEGDSITYAITVNNTGDCALYNVFVNDTVLGPIYTGGLAEGETRIFNVNYTVPTSSGEISNTVIASGSDTRGLEVSDSASWFVIVQHNITFYQSGVGSDFSGTVVTVDSANYSVDDLPVSFWWDDGSIHNFTFYSPLIVTANVEQYVWTGTSGLSGTQSGSITVSGSGNVTGNYKTQFYITVTSAHDSPTASQWVDQGGSITASVTSPADIIPNDQQFVCTGFSVDGEPPTPGTSYTFTNVQAAHSIVFGWKEQHQVTFDQNGVGPDFAGTIVTIDGTNNYVVTDLPVSFWWDANSVHAFSFASPLGVGGGKQYVWASTTGLSTLQGDQLNVTSSGSVTGNYETQYRVTFDESGVGSDFTGTVVTIDETNYSVSDLPVSFWWENASVHNFSFASPLEMSGTKNHFWSSTSGLSTLQNGQLTVTVSGSVAGNYILQDAITFDQTGVGSDFTGTVIIIDGTPYDVAELPVSFYWTAGTVHNFTFQSPLTVAANAKQYVWTSTNGLSAVQSGSITVTTFGSIVGNCKTQYYLTLDTSPPGVDAPTGSGWYDEDSYATISTGQYVDIVSGSSRYRFNGWTTGDMPEIADPSAAFTTVLMDKAKTVTANYVAQYYLTLATNPPGVDAPSGAGWYDADTNAIVSTEGHVDIVAGSSRYRFDEWTTTDTTEIHDPSAASATVLMDKAKTVTANYVVQYYLTVTTSPSGIDSPTGEGWYDTGFVAHVSTSQHVDIVSGSSRYRFDSWTGATGTYVDATAVMDAAKTATANYVVQYLITVISAHDNPTPSDWVDARQDFTASVTSPTEIVPNDHRWVCTGYSVDGGAGQAGTSHKFTDVQAAHTVEFSWKEQFWVQVNSAHGSPTASAWVNQGVSFTASVSSPADTVANDHQWVCIGFSVDGGVSQAGSTYTFSKVQAAHSITFAWKLQFWIQVNSAHDSQTASQWVDQGNGLTVSVASPADDNGAGTRYRCTGYTLDNSPPVSDGSTGYSFANVQSAHVIMFNWIAQFRLIVSSAHDSPSPARTNWYDTGTPISASVTTPADQVGGTRYRCIGYSGTGSVPASGSATSVSFTTSSPSTLTWNWIAQYELTVSSDHDSPAPSVGGHWYDAGTDITASVTSPADDDGLGTRYMCTGYAGSGSVPSSGTSTSVTFAIGAPSTITWNWIAQYRLTVASDHDAPDPIVGARWYDTGTYITASVTSPADDDGAGTRYRCIGWSGTGSAPSIGTEVTTSFALTQPSTLTWSWITQYTLTVASAHDSPITSVGEHWYDADTPVSASISTPADEANGTRWRFTNFTGTGSAPSGSDTSTSFNIEAPSTLTWNWITQYFIAVTSPHDSPTPSAWVDAGSDFTASVTSPTEIVPKDHQWACTGFSVDGGLNQAGTTYTFTNIQAPHTIDFVWKEQFWILVNSEHDSPTASQWIDQGSSLAVDVASPADDDGAGTRYRCTGYTLDNSTPIIDGSTGYSFADVQSAHVIMFNWIAQFRLTVYSAHDSPAPAVGEHWYDAGTPISASVTTPADQVGGTRYKCTGWSGTGSVPASGTGASAAFNIGAPSNVAWNWVAQYYLTMSTNFGTVSPGDGWHDEGSIIAISAAQATTVEGKGYAWHGWTGTGTISYSGSDNLAYVTINSPISETAYWKIVAELTIFVSNETIAMGDRILVYGETLPVSSPAEVNVTYTFPNGTQVTHTLETDDEGHYNDTLFLEETPVYGLLDQRGQWVITAERSGSNDREAAASSTTLGIEAPEISELPLIILVLLTAIAIAISFMIVRRRTNGKKQTHKVWWRATVVLGLAALVLGAASLLLSWMSVAGTAQIANGQKYSIAIGLNPFTLGSVSITEMQYKGPQVPSLISSVWSAVSKIAPPVTTIYLILVGCALALASLYKPKTRRRKFVKLIVAVVAGTLVLVAVVQFLVFIGVYADIVTGAAIGYGVGLAIAMIGSLLTIASTFFAAKETPSNDSKKVH
jgi:uncharacterized repeat protein (TIGR01451 family)